MGRLYCFNSISPTAETDADGVQSNSYSPILTVGNPRAPYALVRYEMQGRYTASMGDVNKAGLFEEYGGPTLHILRSDNETLFTTTNTWFPTPVMHHQGSSALYGSYVVASGEGFMYSEGDMTSCAAVDQDVLFTTAMTDGFCSALYNPAPQERPIFKSTQTLNIGILNLSGRGDGMNFEVWGWRNHLVLEEL